MFVSHVIHPKLLASSILWYSFKKLTPTQLFKYTRETSFEELKVKLNLHLICEYENWVFGIKGWEGKEFVL